MERRKIIKLGNSSFALALPKKWVDKSGLKKGDEVFIVPKNSGELIISAEYKKNGNGKTGLIKIDDLSDEQIRRSFISFYINGYESFEFKGESLDKKERFIKKFIKNFLSCEVSEEKNNSVLIKDFFNLEEMNIDLFTRRAHNNVLEMFDVLIKSFSEKNKIKINLNNIKEADADINKIYFLNSRILNKGLQNPTVSSTLKAEISELFNNWWLSFHLEHIGDSIKAICKKLDETKLNKNLIKTLNPLVLKTKEIYDTTINAFYNKDKDKAQGSIEQGKMLWDKCNKLTKSEDLLIGIICEKLKNIENSTFQIVKMILNLK